MGWITDDHRCAGCDHVYAVLSHRDERNEKSTCPTCGQEGERTMSVPVPLRKSFRDGHKRGETYERLKRAVKIEKEMANLPHDKRAEHKKEIKELKKLT